MHSKGTAGLPDNTPSHSLLQHTAVRCMALGSTQMRQVGLAWLLTCTAVWEKLCQTVAFAKAGPNCLSLLLLSTQKQGGFDWAALIRLQCS